MPTSPENSPRAPIYILSKGRYESLLTMKSLERLGVDYFVAIEPQEEELYRNAMKDFKHHTILILPFSNHGKGGGPARNWCWEHSIASGHDYHWIVDDNIRHFYRAHNNKRVRVDTGAGFRVIEDMMDRYENVMLASMQYHFFAVETFKNPAYAPNTRVMSCILINNKCKHRWRGKYNEDVDLSLRVLKDGDCTMLVYAYLCGKMRTGDVKGGNTQEIYGDGTFEKSKMLAKLHPDVVTLTQRYGRWHHHVDMRPFRHNKFILKEGIEIPTEPNEYGMKLVYNYGTSDQKQIELDQLKTLNFD